MQRTSKKIGFMVASRLALMCGLFAIDTQKTTEAWSAPPATVLSVAIKELNVGTAF
jgi:hypothetical protein